MDRIDPDLKFVFARARASEFLAESERARQLDQIRSDPRIAVRVRAARRWGIPVVVIRGGAPSPAPTSPAAA